MTQVEVKVPMANDLIHCLEDMIIDHPFTIYHIEYHDMFAITRATKQVAYDFLLGPFPLHKFIDKHWEQLKRCFRMKVIGHPWTTNQ